MTLVLRNMQKLVKLNMRRLETEINILRKCFGVEQFDMSVLCICDEEMATLNSAYRRINSTTDVLAFPFYEGLDPGELPEDDNPDEMILGDIFLGVSHISDQCKKYDADFHGTLPIMLTHGMCHLLGYDHETEEQWRKMYSKELQILDEFNKLTGKTCKPLTAVGH
ncbi:endoribonuclease YbeY-like [Haliotis rubra]|uniref:endoribonuclease YbeY-like n=1 Tax=Haliotis rubra TaxID=36100 RepID=UPI001EE53C83|nr:endoribonuclease YbeY-like [Haliotis rubra]